MGADCLLMVCLHVSVSFMHLFCLVTHSLKKKKQYLSSNSNNYCPPAGRNALHIDVHMGTGFIYWCDFSSTVAGQNGVRRIKPDGSGLRSVITSGIGRNGIRGIAVDWAAGRLVFTVSSTGFVWLHTVSPVQFCLFVKDHILHTFFRNSLDS